MAERFRRAPWLGTNSSGQPISAATTGSGSVVLATSPTLSGTTVSGATTMQGNVTLQNGANASQTMAIQPGSSADQIGAMQFNNYSGTAKVAGTKGCEQLLARDRCGELAGPA